MVALSPTIHALFATVATTALRSGGQNASSTWSAPSQVADCNITGFVPTFPPNQTQLVVPSDLQPHFIGLAFGVQNYTCTSSNTYSSIGAVAEVIDVSCYVNETWFSTIQQPLYNVWSNVSGVSILDIIDFLHSINPPQILAQHYFVTNPVTGSGVSPKWDFTSSGKFNGNPNAFMIGRVNGTLPSPNNATEDVAWLEVLKVSGDIAVEVFRYDTVGGQPPSSCTYGKSSNISVDYTSKYIFYGGSIN
ncbi:hypothetical protein AcV7_002594 [Taiwanofungus camphoratus]|nr:hypothetical protein AcV7_002594 [Antrodia cinnamomea]